jgi:hypothetical protein
MCKNTNAQTYYAAFPEKRRAIQLKNKFNLTIKEWDDLFDKQKGVCAICAHPEQNGKRLSIDHCHTSGRIRGLVCNRCNSGLGRFDDDSKLMRRAVEYLEQ